MKNNQYNINFIVEAPDGVETSSAKLNHLVETALLDEGLDPVIAQTRSLNDEEEPQVGLEINGSKHTLPLSEVVNGYLLWIQAVGYDPTRDEEKTNA